MRGRPALFRVFALAALIAAPAGAGAQSLDESCRPVFARYGQAPGPKAFAAGRTRGCGWRSGGGAIAEVQALALGQCRANGGDDCRIVASEATGAAGRTNAQGRTPQCEQAFGRYRAAAGPKAFAQGSDGSCGWQVQTGQLRTPQEIQARAVEQCRGNGGRDCRVVNTAN